MSRAGDYVLGQALRLVRHCDRCRTLLRVVLDWADRGLYDPVSDAYAMRLPGGIVRDIRGLLEESETEQQQDEVDTSP